MSQDSKESKCILTSKLSSTIAFTDKLPIKDCDIENLTHEQLKERTNGRMVLDENSYSDIPLEELVKNCPPQGLVLGLYLSSTVITTKQYILSTQKRLINDFEATREQPFDKIVVVDLEKALGKPGLGLGIFAKENIPKGAVMGHFAGTFRRIKTKASNIEEYLQYQDALRWDGSEYCICPHGKKGRGLASYFQHLPERVLLSQFKKQNELVGQSFDRDQHKLKYDFLHTDFGQTIIAEENIGREFLLSKSNVPVVILVAKNDIAKGSPLGFNYVSLFLKSYPEYFDPQGMIIPHDRYKRFYGRFVFPNGVFQGDFGPLIKKLNTGSSEIQLENYHEKGKMFRVSAEELRNRLEEANAIVPREAKLDVKPALSRPIRSQPLDLSYKQATVLVKLPAGSVVEFSFPNQKSFKDFQDLVVALTGFQKKDQPSTSVAYNDGQYSISYNHLQQVNKFGAEGIADFAKYFGCTEENFREKLGLNKPAEQKASVQSDSQVRAFPPPMTKNLNIQTIVPSNTQDNTGGASSNNPPATPSPMQKSSSSS